MAGEEVVTAKDQSLQKLPKKEQGQDVSRGLHHRQLVAMNIHSLGEKLKLSRRCVARAHSYMHRFYQCHPITVFKWDLVAVSCLFLACKVDEEHRCLDQMLVVAKNCINRGSVQSMTRDQFRKEAVFHEHVLLATLNFDCFEDQHLVFIAEFMRKMKATWQQTKEAFAVAACLPLMTLCLDYQPVQIACVCIYIASKKGGYEVPTVSGDNTWFLHLDPAMTRELLREMAHKYNAMYSQCPRRYRDVLTHFMQAISTKEAERMVPQHTVASLPQRSPASRPSSRASSGYGTSASTAGSSSGVPRVLSTTGSASARRSAPPAALNPRSAGDIRDLLRDVNTSHTLLPSRAQLVRRPAPVCHTGTVPSSKENLLPTEHPSLKRRRQISESEPGRSSDDPSSGCKYRRMQ